MRNDIRKYTYEFHRVVRMEATRAATDTCGGRSPLLLNTTERWGARRNRRIAAALTRRCAAVVCVTGRGGASLRGGCAPLRRSWEPEPVAPR